MGKLLTMRHALGDYQDVLTILRPVAEGSPGWETVATGVYGRVVALSAWQRLQAAQLQDAVEYRAWVPARTFVLDTTMRLVWQNALRGPLTLAIRTVVAGAAETVCDCVEAHP